jgi:hypothetical protein
MSNGMAFGGQKDILIVELLLQLNLGNYSYAT